jgi:cytochrome c oxidase accessory protein FixG
MIFQTFRAKRWIAAWIQAAILLGLPFIRVDGESALRFDVPSLKLYFFGSVVWISEAFFYLLLFLLFFIGVMLFTVLYGRIWCGWMCPQTVLSDFTRIIKKAVAGLTGHPVLEVVLSHAFLLLFSVLVSANLIWYFVPPYDMLRDATAFSLGRWTLGSWILFTMVIYTNLALVRQKFCGTVCPYARLQSAFFDQKTLTIAFDKSGEEDCLGCEACVRACPSGIDIRNGLQVECINCAECIDACAGMVKRAGRRPVIGYVFGRHGSPDRGARPRVIGLSALFALLAVLLAYQVHVRVPVDFWVIRDESQPYHQVGIKGALLNTFDFLVENRSLNAAEYSLSISGVKELEVVMPRNPFVLPPNSAVKFRIYVFAKAGNLSERVTQLRFALENTRRPEIRVVRETSFIYPERTDRGVEI